MDRNPWEEFCFPTLESVLTYQEPDIRCSVTQNQLEDPPRQKSSFDQVIPDPSVLALRRSSAFGKRQDGFIQQSEWNKATRRLDQKGYIDTQKKSNNVVPGQQNSTNVRAFIHSTFFYHKTTTLSTTTLATTQRTTVPHTVITVTEPPPIVVDRATLHKFVGEMVKRTRWGWHMMGKEGQHSAEQAFGALDLNGDGYAARGELLNALGQLREPMRGQDARVVFQGVDANEDGVVEFPEFKAAFEYAREHEGDGTEPHKPATRTNPGEENVEVKVAPPQEQNDNPRTRDWDVKLAKVLQEMRLNEPPISMARFVHGMGSVPAETAFKALDELSQDEMVRFAKAFVPPLTQTEALFAHKGMDINDDGRVVPAETWALGWWGGGGAGCPGGGSLVIFICFVNTFLTLLYTHIFWAGRYAWLDQPGYA
ncbi:unnamed protein product [Durusdinium trenchii]|uniref:EF-hand domain-containing protein n=1 Tax=Durusdinium trenchii TaxID=1381693 RepID=A0ABP0RKX7_9DINO